MNSSIRAILFIFCSGLAFTALSQDTSQESIIGYANQYLEAIESQNFQKITNMTYDNIVEMAGGSKLFIKSLEEAGISAGRLVEPKVLNVSEVVNAEKEMHAIVTYETVMKLTDAKFKATRNLLACSDDNGNSWKFVDLEHFDMESLKLFVPLYNPALVIPTKLEPTIIEE